MGGISVVSIGYFCFGVCFSTPPRGHNLPCVVLVFKGFLFFCFYCKTGQGLLHH